MNGQRNKEEEERTRTRRPTKYFCLHLDLGLKEQKKIKNEKNQ